MNPDGSTGQGGAAGERYRFGGVLVDATAHTLVRQGQPVSVEPKAFAVLLLLLRHAGELVNRDDLLDAVWGHRHVTPGVLTRVIAQLRHALDDHPHEPRYIQTVHALGYRFVGELERETPPAGSPVTGHEPAIAPVGSPANDLGSAEATAAAAAPASPHLPGPATVAAVTPPPLRRPTRGASHARSWIAAAAVVLIAVAALLWLDRAPAPVSQRPAEASIAVLPFTNLSSAPDDSYFAEGLAIEMHDALAGVRGLKVAAQPAGGLGRTGLEDVRSLGKALGVATVLAASVRREGTRVRVNARLSDTRTGFTLWSKSYDRETSDVFAVQSEIASQVVQALLGVLPSDRPQLDRRLAPTRDLTAYDAYLKGLQRLQASGSSEEQLDQAIGFFSQALAADVGFARAQAGICRAEIGRFERARDAAAFARAQAACERAAKMDPDLREVSLAFGELHRVRGETGKANEHYTRALDDPALRPAAYIGLARMQSALGNNQLALDYFQRARELRPGDSVIYRELGYHQYLNDDLPHAIESFRAAATLQPDDASAWTSLGGLYLAHGDPVQADEAFSRSLAIKPSYGALSNLGTLRYGEGAYAQAAALYRRAAELDPDDYRVWGNIGDALSAQPATAAQARDPYRRAADMATSYVAIKADDAQALGLLAWYRANLGERQAALEALARAEKLSSERGEVALAGAQALALLGDVEGARERVMRAQAHGISLQRIRSSPVLRRSGLDDTPALRAQADPVEP